MELKCSNHTLNETSILEVHISGKGAFFTHVFNSIFKIRFRFQ